MESDKEIIDLQEFISEDDEQSTELVKIDEEPKSKISEHKKSTIENVEQHSLEDYEYVRASLYETLEKGQEVLDTAVNIAKETEAPAAIKAVTDMMKTLIDTNKELLAVQKETMAISRDYEDMIFDEDEYNKSHSGGSTQNLGHMVDEKSSKDDVQVTMTTAQFLEMMEKEEQPEPIIINPEPDDDNKE